MAMTIGDLLAALKDEDPTAPVILQKDCEGNGFSPLEGADGGLYAAETTYSGEVYNMPEDQDDEDPAPESAVRCFVLWPVN
jgi:hypothetical protein